MPKSASGRSASKNGNGNRGTSPGSDSAKAGDDGGENNWLPPGVDPKPAAKVVDEVFAEHDETPPEVFAEYVESLIESGEVVIENVDAYKPPQISADLWERVKRRAYDLLNGRA